MEQIFQDENSGTLNSASKRIYKKGDVIYHEETPSFGIFYIGRGTVKIFTLDRDGKEVILRLATTGDLLGYGFLLGEKNHQNSAKVLVESECFFIEASIFKRLIQKEPKISSMTMEKIGKELTIFQNRYVDLMKKNVRERLASYFCYMAHNHADNDENDLRIKLQLSREEIASMIGTANETAIRFISEFKELGLISEEDRFFHILDLKRLHSLGRLH